MRAWDRGCAGLVYRLRAELLLPTLLPRSADLQQPANKWTVGGTPLLSMMHLERRSGR